MLAEGSGGCRRLLQLRPPLVRRGPLCTGCVTGVQLPAGRRPTRPARVSARGGRLRGCLLDAAGGRCLCHVLLGSGEYLG